MELNSVQAEKPAMAAHPQSEISVAEVILRTSDTLLAQIKRNRADFKEVIGENVSFDYLGLDSVARVDFLTALEKEFSITLDPTAAFDFQTVGALSHYVWGQITGKEVDFKKVLEV